MGVPDSRGEHTDDASIKPVSSLKSHFENIIVAGRPPGPSTPSPPPPPHPRPQSLMLPLLGLDRDRGRMSVGPPDRANNPWRSSSSLGFETLDRLRPQVTAGTPAGWSSEPSATFRQRPLSVGPATRFRPAPTATAQMRGSPPASAPSNGPGDGDARTYGRFHALGIPERFSASEPSPPAPSGPSRPGQIKKAHLPPPVNRAAKPITPTAAAGGGTLGPVNGGGIGRNKVSPFSTPPGSEGSPEPSPTEDRSFPYPPARQHVDVRREPIARKSSRPPAQDPLDHPDRRPSLPVRTETSRSPSADTSPAPGPVHTVQRLRADPSKRASLQYPRPSPAAKNPRPVSEFLPPPKRHSPAAAQDERPHLHPAAPEPPYRIPPPSQAASDRRAAAPPRSRIDRMGSDEADRAEQPRAASSDDYPDASQSNRRLPHSRYGVDHVWTQYETRLFDLCGRHVCTTGYITRAWDLTNGRTVTDMGHGEKDVKVTSLVFRPGATEEEEGLTVWLGNNQGDIQEVDLRQNAVVRTKPGAHPRRDIVKMYRYQNSIWSLDDDGRLSVWLADDRGVPSLGLAPLAFKVAKGHSFSIIANDLLWLAAGKEIRIYNPVSGGTGDASFYVTKQALAQPNAGDVTSGAVVSNQLDRVYFGHSDGKVSIYSTADYAPLGVVSISNHKITSLAGAGFYLWAGFSTGTIYVYDTRPSPWKVKKEWQAHDGPVANMVVDRSSVWKFGHLQVASIGLDNAIRLWDGMLEDDWLENEMWEHDVAYCDFREIKAVVVTWNAGASTPASLRHEERDANFFRDVIQVHAPPDLLVFGFQELVDLEDKKLTAKSLFKGSKKKEPSEHERMSHQYRAWRDFLVRAIEDNMPPDEPYHLLHTASMVGLFSCIFVKAAQRSRIRSLHTAEVKRGLGGLHGNKGALIVRFILDDSSLCFTNCHLAAGQSQTVNRNNDVTAILEATVLPAERDAEARLDTFVGGGDGSMIIDHEICVLNGDLNYRIDTMGKDAVVKAIQADNLPRLLERDQLLVSRRRNPGFRLRTFHESPITFAPTYKYDVGTDRYDSSEKNRAPAWCDRLLYRGAGRIKQVDYRRHEVRVSDHRPVSGTFKMRIKTVIPEKRRLVWEQCEARLIRMRQKLARDAKLDYLVSVLGVDGGEAARLIDQ